MSMAWRLYLRMFLSKALKNISGGVFERGAIPPSKRAYKATNMPNDIII